MITQTLIYYVYLQIIFQRLTDEFEGQEILLDNKRFLKLLNKTKISISNDDTRHYLKWHLLSFTEANKETF